ncbi:MAG: hypothetical protein HQ551_10285 [Desulfobacteraceae bacterium]|nr:hypothetical protein [Desulfobacteraceae bacterium]
MPNKRDLIKVIDKSSEDLHQKIDMHRYLMTTILEQRVGDKTLNTLLLPSYSPDESRLKEVVKEAIEVLEESRKSFKSKRLESLRKKLTQALIE